MPDDVLVLPAGTVDYTLSAKLLRQKEYEKAFEITDRQGWENAEREAGLYRRRVPYRCTSPGVRVAACDRETLDDHQHVLYHLCGEPFPEGETTMSEWWCSHLRPMFDC